MQAKLLEHSEELMHSGRQFGADPIYSGKHEQEAEPLASVQTALGPHGEG